jgi:hypothetical protein
MKRRHFLAATGTAGTWRISNAAPAPQRLVVAAFPLVDKIVEAAMPAWQAQHPPERNITNHSLPRQP